jgi:hypothetical protein
MKIEFLYFADCPSHEDALARVRQVLIEERVAADIAIIQVETHEQAQIHRFTGSPTIRFNGRDIDPPPADAQYSLACRAYHLRDGRISPLPSLEMIRTAALTAIDEENN